MLDLVVDTLALGLAVGNGGVDQGGILGLLGSGQDQGGVGGGILGLVLADSCEGLAKLSLGHSVAKGGRHILAKSPSDAHVSGGARMHAS